MKSNFANLNLAMAWLWIVLGFASGFVLGCFFHRENWLGGYASHKRRLYRLAHISFFGLGLVNLCFYLTAKGWADQGGQVEVASWALVVGALTMPVCCVAMAHQPRMQVLFG